jgi:hypothetical protein
MTQVVSIPVRSHFFGKDFAKHDIFDEVTYIHDHRRPFKYEYKKVRIQTDVVPWLLQACEYVKTLSKRQQTCLFAYSTPEFWTINVHKSGVDASSHLLWEPIEDYSYLAYELLIAKDRDQLFTGDLREALSLRRKVKSLKRQPDAFDAYDAAFRDFAKLVGPERYTDRFYARAEELAVRQSPAILFYDQFNDLFGPLTLREYFKRIPHVSQAQWKAVLDLFVEELDALILGTPPTPSPVVLYRGTKGKRVRSRRTYTSMTLSKEVAKEFADCRLHELRFPKGSRLLPMMCASRYSMELEVLALPSARYRQQTI